MTSRPMRNSLRSNRAKSSLAAGLLFAAGLCLAGCGPSLEIPPLPEVPAPDLSAAERPVAEQVSEAREDLAEAKRGAENLTEVGGRIRPPR